MWAAGRRCCVMNRQEIISAVQKADNTVLSFPERGPWDAPETEEYTQCLNIKKESIRKALI